ncbi:MAG TPA: PBP1A family penicillin-binding protein [Candidatus Paceibacterota bacterium]|nr:PBP1A family penicillin-binding protein [Candidatus Paceibacterota bacterium]
MKNIFKFPERYSSIRRKLSRLKKPRLSKKGKKMLVNAALIGSALCLFTLGAGLLWFATLKIPDLDSFDQRILGQSTKIFDKTGKILLYDMGQNMRRTIVPLEEMSDYVKQATIAIEDDKFYEHNGFRLSSFIRAVLANISTGEYSQGGSTITQQVIKNSLLTKDKTLTRKLKEIFLAIKLERVLSKDEILHLYLNESPYGGTIYGIEEASQAFFGKTAKDLTLVESAYLAALPQAPSYYSPYGKHRDDLERRKNLVLTRMYENDMIDEKTYEQAKSETASFESGSSSGIKAPHFVMFIRQYLEEQYGDRAVAEGGLKVITTLDYELQKKAEEIVKKHALENEKNYKASNAALVAIDAKTGQILTMVGSRDYFDKQVDGNYNIATAKRQPGSSFKPFVYVKAFEKGYRPETVLYDLKTQFSTRCQPNDMSGDDKGCYSPENYDNLFRGPMTLRSALAQSINIPAVKLFYLIGMKDTLELTKKLGISTLTDPSRYGLSLVLGGGEVTLLEMVGAYATLANAGERHVTTGVLKVEDKKGNVLEEWKDESEVVIDKQATLLLSDVLSDNQARLPAYSANSPLNFADRDVAAKTGTTNDYRDTWIMGYTPQVAVGAWAGNNNNSSIDKRVAGFVVAPMWREFMDEILKTLPDEKFEAPAQVDLSRLPPAISGSQSTLQEPHSILHWIDKSDPLGSAPRNPGRDPQYIYWEYPIRLWASINHIGSGIIDVNGLELPETEKTVRFINPSNNQRFDERDTVTIRIGTSSDEPIKKAEYFLNGTYVGSPSQPLADFELNLGRTPAAKDGKNTLKVVVTDVKEKQSDAVLEITVR